MFFEEQEVKCKSCGMVYLQYKEEQVPGFRTSSEDVCPYCKACNDRSLEYEFTNERKK